MEREPPRYPIESVDNAVQLLLALHERGSITVVEGSRLLNVARSTAHRLLAMLQYRGLVQQDPVLKTYLPGPVLIEIGLAAVHNIDLGGHVRPHLEHLAQDVTETAHLVVRRGASVMFLDCVESDRALRAGSRTGTILPAHCTASGKALLAGLPDDTVRLLFSGGLPPLTDRSLTTMDELLGQLAVVRRRGYAINLGESEDQLNAVARAIHDQSGAPVGAITVAGPSFRLREPRLAEVASRIGEAAAAISRSLQVIPSAPPAAEAAR